MWKVLVEEPSSDSLPVRELCRPLSRFRYPNRPPKDRTQRACMGGRVTDTIRARAGGAPCRRSDWRGLCHTHRAFPKAWYGRQQCVSGGTTLLSADGLHAACWESCSVAGAGTLPRRTPHYQLTYPLDPLRGRLPISPARPGCSSFTSRRLRRAVLPAVLESAPRLRRPSLSSSQAQGWGTPLSTIGLFSFTSWSPPRKHPERAKTIGEPCD